MRRRIGFSIAVGLVVLAAGLTWGLLPHKVEDVSPPVVLPRASSWRAPDNPDPWVLICHKPSPAALTHLGNGYLGFPAGGSGGLMEDMAAARMFVSGLYTRGELTAAPLELGLYVEADGRRVFPPDTPKAYEQHLDLKKGLLTTQYTTWVADDPIQVESRLIACRHLPGVARLAVKVVPGRAAYALAARRVTAAGERTLQGSTEQRSSPANLVCQQHEEGDSLSITTWTTSDGASALCAATRVRYPSTPAQAGEEAQAEAIMAVTQAAAPEVARQQALAIMRAAESRGFDEALHIHQTAWEQLWTSDIIIQGDPEAQQVVHSCLFYLLQSLREDGEFSVPPFGLSADRYKGHIFWDADTFIFPAIAPLHPKLGRAIVDYRVRTMKGAMRNAQGEHLPGASYAWESAESGEELAPADFPKGRHVTGDVALALWWYYQISGDDHWLREQAWPVLKNTADQWVARAYHNQTEDRYEIRQVISPDESAGIVQNSLWTNFVAKRNLEIASQVAVTAPDPLWEKVSAQLWLPFDPARQAYLAYEGDDGEHPSKQANAELVIFPGEMAMDPVVAANTFDLHRSRSQGRGPAMTEGIHAVIAARLGRTKQALQHFRQSYRPYLKGPFNHFSEYSHRDWSCFLTGCAGPVIAVLYGFAGLSPGGDPHQADPHLPESWTKLEIRGYHYRGRAYDIIITPDQPPQITPHQPRPP